MQQNQNVTPQMAELGAAIISAVHAVIDNPEEARAAVLAHSDAQQLSGEQLSKLESDREFMAHADAERDALDALKNTLDKQKSEQDEIAIKLNKAYDIHTTNVEALAESVKLHNEDIKQFDEDKKNLDGQKNAFANEYSELLTAQEENRKWEADLMKREQALQRAAESMGWQKSAKG